MEIIMIDVLYLLSIDFYFIFRNKDYVPFENCYRHFSIYNFKKLDIVNCIHE